MADNLLLNGVKMEDKFIDFNFILDERIPREVGLEFVAIRQFALAVLAAMEPEKRENIISNLSKVQSPQMKDIVRNLKLIKS